MSVPNLLPPTDLKVGTDLARYPCRVLGYLFVYARVSACVCVRVYGCVCVAWLCVVACGCVYLGRVPWILQVLSCTVHYIWSVEVEGRGRVNGPRQTDGLPAIWDLRSGSVYPGIHCINNTGRKVRVTCNRREFR